MINRELIRLKVVQLVYADYKNEGKSVDDAMKELVFSLSKAYDLYHYLLLLITEITDYGRRRYDSLNERLKAIDSEDTSKARFVNNRFAALLAENKQLYDFFEKPETHKWLEQEGLVKKLYKQISESKLYEDYMALQEDSFETDREFWRKAYKQFICNNEDVESALEEWSLYWNDDKDVVDTFVLKTIKRITENDDKNQPLLPAYSADEDREFAGRLFEAALIHRDEYENLIRNASRNWDFERIAVMDVVIMICALAEIFTFPAIPVSITLNEYIELAKVYSSPRSAGFVNGLLDHIVKRLRTEGRISK
jgi:N utilization substance protein B